MRILFLSPRQCWPPVSGAKLRDYHLARALGNRSELTYVYFADSGDQAQEKALNFCRRVVPIPRPAMYTPAKLVRGLLGRQPLPIVNYSSPRMNAAVSDMFRGQSFDLVHADSIHMAAAVAGLGNARVIYNWHNIESELMFRYAQETGSAVRRIYASITARRLKRAESEILTSAFGQIVCSERERRQLFTTSPGARIEVIENGVDVPAFEETARTSGSRHRLLFVGAMSYHANIEAAVSFARDVWPAIRQRMPDWTLTLVGSNPHPRVQALADQPAIEVTGTVPDTRAYYREAIAAIAPLRSGGGTRLKILEAMAAGVPVVSSKLGAEGLAVVPGTHILVAETSAEWLEALAALEGQGEQWRAMRAAGLELVKSRYDWERLGQALYETYGRWLEQAR